MSTVVDGRARSANRRAAQSLALATPRVSVVIPALNEARNLERLLPMLPDGSSR